MLEVPDWPKDLRLCEAADRLRENQAERWRHSTLLRRHVSFIFDAPGLASSRAGGIADADLAGFPSRVVAERASSADRLLCLMIALLAARV
jgi:hypothetical protein